MEPGGREPAPEPLHLVQRFVNSYDHLTGRGILETPEALDRWLAARSFLPPPGGATPADIRFAHTVREALRGVLRSHNGDALDPAATRALNDASGRAPMTVRLGPHGRPEIAPLRAGVRGAVAVILGAAAEAEYRGMWDRLKACRSCGWVFYDHSRNRSGSWCTMAICGSREKMRAYRSRQKHQAGP